MSVPVPQQRVLLVDDDHLLQELMQLYLEQSGYAVLLAGNGREALEVLERSDVDRIILDLMMPEMDGLQFLRRLRRVRESTIPVLVLTAMGWEGFEDEVLEAGANRVGFKPIDKTELLTLLQQL